MAVGKTYGQIPRMGRVMRNPTHPFYVESQPFTLQPILIAPVLPGETLKNAQVQSRVVTDPIKNKLIGWWQEYYFFYVKHRDLSIRDDLTEMMLDMNKDMSAVTGEGGLPFISGGVVPQYGAYTGGANWVALCMQRVHETYFREEGQPPFDTDTGFAVAVNSESFIQSAGLNDLYQIDDPELTVGADDKITGSEVSAMLQTWQMQRANNLTEMSYEDWLRTYGISTPREELHRPELLRYMREWQYPSNTINPETGAASSAVSWSISDRIDKDRFFREPGFIVGYSVTRPKVYMKNLDGSAVGMMKDALTWLPALMRDDPWSSMKKLGAAEGPLATVVTDTDGYWLDVKDLLLYGDDYVNVARSGTGLNMVSLPSADLANKDFPSNADINALFAGSTDATRRVRQDGIVRLSIAGTQTDTTPGNSMGT